MSKTLMPKLAIEAPVEKKRNINLQHVGSTAKKVRTTQTRHCTESSTKIKTDNKPKAQM